jgi:hypothetical protein
LDIEHLKFVLQGEIAYVGPIFKLIPFKRRILEEHPALRELDEGATG